MIAWTAFGAAMAETTSTLETRDRTEIVRALEVPAGAARGLAAALSHNPAEA